MPVAGRGVVGGGAPRPRSRAKLSILFVPAAVVLAACSVDELSVGLSPTADEDGEEQILEFPPGQPVRHRLRARISGGIPPYETRIEGCPDWVTLFPDQGILAGTAPASAGGQTFFCRYVVTDSNTIGEPTSTSFGLQLDVLGGKREKLVIAVRDNPDANTLTLDFSAEKAIQRNLTLDVTGGVAPYVARIEGCPDWVTLFPDQGILAGTAPASAGGQTFFCRYVVTDSNTIGEPASTSFGLKLTVKGPEAFALPAPDAAEFMKLQNLKVGAFHTLTLPAATGGVAPYTYAFTCAGGSLPPGMGFEATTRVLAGTPTAAFRDTCAYTATDSSQPAATVSRPFDVAVEGLEDLDFQPAPQLSQGLKGLQVGTFASLELPAATGGVSPYTYALTCAGGSLPPGMGFEATIRVLAGTPTAAFRDTCAYTVMDSSQPAATGSQSFEVAVTPLDRGSWRFRTRSVAENLHPVDRDMDDPQPFVPLPHAIPGPNAPDGVEVKYEFLPEIRPPLTFDGTKRQLSYTQPEADPVFNTPTTYRYRAYLNLDSHKMPPEASCPEPDKAYSGNDAVPCKYVDVQDVLCVDVSFRDEDPADNDKTDGLLSTVSVWIRDDAFLLAGGEYRCPDAPRPEPLSSRAMTSNPVHLALGPIHARRAVDVAHAAVRGRVRGWSPGAQEGWTLSPAVEVAYLSGMSGGFDYTGSSRSLRVGTEAGADAWQTGLVAALTETELRYRAEANLAQLGYRSGEHDTGIVSLHPFVAWHVPSGGHLWMSIGAGVGQLQHRDAPAFPSLSSSDVRLQAYALEATLPVAEVMQGTLDAEAGVASFAFDIGGGDQISAEIPTLRGLDYRAGLAWNSPGPGVPSVALAYRQLTGDGPEGALLEAQGAVSADGLLKNIPRFSLKGTVTASLGLGDHEQESLSVGASARFAPGRAGRGFDASLDTRLASSADARPTGLGLQGEAGYGFWGGPLFGMIRPYAGLLASPGGGSNRRALGLDLLGMSRALVNVEVYDRHPVSGVQFNLYRRF